MQKNIRAKPVNILLVEDNPGDVRLTVEIFKEGKVINSLAAVSDGVEAMEFMRRQGRHSRAMRPDLVLLDLNLPRKDGRTVLAEMKADPDLRRIPVVILTTSQAESDILKSYESHANCYISKPVALEEFIDVVRQIEGFWLTIVKLPSDQRA
jgi:CheY-like chemotaxis protein